MKTEHLTLVENQSILTLTLQRPERLNALSPTLLSELKTCLSVIAKEPLGRYRGMMVASEGERAFVAGADIRAMSEMTETEGADFGVLGQEVMSLFEILPFPVIACVHGHALGGGCELALGCDLIFATESARFGQPEVNLGLIPGFGGCIRLPQRIGVSKAREWIYSGLSVSAKEAQELGLVNRVFQSRKEMLVGAESYLRETAKKSPLAISVCKQVIQQSLGKSTKEGLEMEKKGFSKVFGSPEKVEGTKAFLEKRAPRFVSVGAAVTLALGLTFFGALTPSAFANTGALPKPIGAYSTLVKAGETYYASGQLGLDPATHQLRTTFSEQLAQILTNSDAILKEHGLKRSDIIKTTLYVASFDEDGQIHREHYKEINESYGNYFSAPYPARSTLGVKALPKGALIEIEWIAFKRN